MVGRLASLLLITALGMGAGARTPRSAGGLPPVFVPPPILMYHRVDDDRPPDAVGRDLTVTPEQFAEQLAYLRSRGITGISMAQLVKRLRAGAPLSRTVVLTFDDGYADQYANAVPLLRRYGDSATFYIITGIVGAPRHLTWQQILRMRAAGEDIAAHGVAHDDLSQMSELQQKAQIDGSLAALRTRLHAPVQSYGYPSGRFNRTTLALVRQAGVDLAVTTDPTYVIAPLTRFEMSRVRVRSEWSIAGFSAAVRRAQAAAQIVRS